MERWTDWKWNKARDFHRSGRVTSSIYDPWLGVALDVCTFVRCELRLEGSGGAPCTSHHTMTAGIDPYAAITNVAGFLVVAAGRACNASRRRLANTHLHIYIYVRYASVWDTRAARSVAGRQAGARQQNSRRHEPRHDTQSGRQAAGWQAISSRRRRRETVQPAGMLWLVAHGRVTVSANPSHTR